MIKLDDDVPNKPVQQKRRKRSLYEIIKERRKQQPATDEEIEQLKKELVKAQLNQKIAEAKSKIPSKLDKIRRFTSIFGPVEETKTKTKGKKQSPKKDIFAEKLRDAAGTNEKDYSGLTG